MAAHVVLPAGGFGFSFTGGRESILGLGGGSLAGSTVDVTRSSFSNAKASATQHTLQ